MCEEELETLLSRVRLDYRDLWLNDADKLGLIAEYLAEATGWEPTDEQILPDPLALAQDAAQRIATLERNLAGTVRHRRPEGSRRKRNSQHLTYALN